MPRLPVNADGQMDAEPSENRKSTRAHSNRLPERFKDDGDAQLDVTAPPPGAHSRDGHMRYLHHSIFSMIAAVGSRSDFHSRFEESSDSDGETDEMSAKESPPLPTAVPPSKHGRLAQSTIDERGRTFQSLFRDHKPLSQIPCYNIGRRREKSTSHAEIPETSAGPSRLAADLRRPRSATPRAVPVLSKMVEAQARFDTEQSAPEGTQGLSLEQPKEEPQRPSSSTLSTRLMEIFEFVRPEKVIVEYSCSLLQSMLLQGYMYVTEGHVCFYAYLPKKSTVAIKSGYLSKRGRNNPRYKRYWFSLKGDVLSYYKDWSKLYFPHGHIDLRYGISASLAEQKDKEKEKEVKDFQVTTDQDTYYFRAESPSNAREWVKSLQKVIFRTHNEGDSVKISFPIENIIDIEESPMVDFAETFKIRVVEAGETYGVDEYFFAFTDSSNDAYNLLKGLIHEGPEKAPSLETASQATHRNSPERHRTASVSRQPIAAESDRHSESGVAAVEKKNILDHSPRIRSRRLSDSFVNSPERGTESSAVIQSISDTPESASQILNRSDVFRSPTIHTLGRRPSAGRSYSDRTVHTVPRQVDVPPAMPAHNVLDTQHTINESDGQAAQEPSGLQPTTPILNDVLKAGAYPLQRAAGFAEYLKSRSKQMSSLLASESMGYIEKVSGMWAGGRQHYGESERIIPEDRAVDTEDKETGCNYGDRFRAHFALPQTEKLQATYFAYLHRVIPIYGKIYISQRKICFRNLLPIPRTKMILPLRDIENVEKEKGFRFGYSGLVIIVRGHEELFFEFRTADARDDCAVTLHQHLESVKYLVESGLLLKQEKEEAEEARAEHYMLQEARNDASAEQGSPTASNDESEMHSIFDDPHASIVNFKPSESLRITCLTIGSRGDVQPYIALCKGLLAEGHRPKIATHREFEPWVRKHGIDFAPVEGDPAELMRICVENGMFTYSFLKEASQKFRGWIDQLLSSAWASCQDTDVLIESPSAMAGIHIAEALRIPYLRAFTMPWTRTRAYPHAFAVPEHKMGGAYNYLTYVMFDNVFWKAIAGQINRWRKKELGLKATNLNKMQQNQVPFLYNYSPTVVPPPLDYPDFIHITGYWFLREASDWTPPPGLLNFIQRARTDGKKIVYIGFGSIVVSDPTALTETVVQSVLKADVRCILSKGWSDRLGDPSSAKSEIPLPPEIFQIQSAPHDWLFRQVDAAAHHGGAGTTGASLQAGIPTIIKPFFGDQFFFGSRVEDLGVGICMKKLNVTVFSRALWEATCSERIITKARQLGEQIRREDGIANAIQAIYRDLEYAQTLSYRRSLASSTPFSPTPSPKGGAKNDEESTIEDDLDDTEWTLVDEDLGTNNNLSNVVREGAVYNAGMPAERVRSKGPSGEHRSSP